MPVAVGGGDPAGAAAAAAFLIARGVAGLVSFGLAGGLDPRLPAGAVLVPDAVLAANGRWATNPALSAWLGGATGGLVFGDGGILGTAGAKRALWQRTGAIAVDRESAAVARAAAAHGLPFAVLRAVCDPASRDLPHAALVALDNHGRIGALRVAGAVLSRPWQVPALLQLAGDARRARRALLDRVAAIG